MTIKWEWLPNISLGPFKLGEKIDRYINNFSLQYDNDEDDTGWIQYKIPSEKVYIEVNAKTNFIESLLTYDALIYKKKNLIGLSIQEIEELLKCKYDEKGDSVIYDDNDVQTPYEYYEHGLQVWVSDGKVVSASCVNYSE